MSSRRVHVDIPLRVDGKMKFIKGVTKFTTSGDVLKMVLKKDIIHTDNDKTTSYGIFESSRGIERLLPGKSRLLKVMRTWGTTIDYEFVLRTVNPVMSLPKVSEAKRRKLSKLCSKKTLDMNMNKENNFDNNLLAGTIDNEVMRPMKHNVARSNNGVNAGIVQEIYFSETDNTMRKCLSNGDKTHLAIPSVNDVCYDVMSRECNDIPSVSDFEMSRNVTGASHSSSDLVDSRHVATTSRINQVKYATRKQLKSKSIETACTTSSSSIDSTNNYVRPEDTYHSTPCNSKRSRGKHSQLHVIKHKVLAQTIKSQISKMNQKEGKEAILQKYFADYLFYRSPKRRIHDTRYRERGDGAESGDESGILHRGDGSDDLTNDTHNNSTNDIQNETNTRSSNQTRSRNLTGDLTNEKSSHLINRVPATYPNSYMAEVDLDVTGDSGQEDGDFDNAFIDENIEEEHTDGYTNGLRKLVDYSLTESDISEIVGDEQGDASDISEIEGDKQSDVGSVSSTSDIIKNIFSDNVYIDEDDDMDSFMVTKLSDDISDEGLSSLGSDDDHEKEYIV